MQQTFLLQGKNYKTERDSHGNKEATTSLFEVFCSEKTDFIHSALVDISEDNSCFSMMQVKKLVI